MAELKVLFIHQNFPGQFKHLANALVDQGYEVSVLSPKKSQFSIAGVEHFRYPINRATSKTVHSWASDFETKVIRGEYCARGALQLKKQGYYPDKIIAHPGWGEALFLREIWPDSKLGIYSEYFYRASGQDVGFDPEFGDDSFERSCHAKAKNAHGLIALDECDAAICPTAWQRSTYPKAYQDKISIIHDGIDTDRIAPDINATITLKDGTQLTHDSEVVTFINRNLEPLRGFHIFIRSLNVILRERKNLRVLIVGDDGIGYGAAPPETTYGRKSWKEIFLAEVMGTLNSDELSRIHFVGRVPGNILLKIMQVSTAHVYLTYPFVLSWSLLEAMSAGCAVVASNTEPVREVLKDGKTGMMFDFFDHGAISDIVLQLCENDTQRSALGRNARKEILKNYDLKTQCLPRQLEWVQAL